MNERRIEIVKCPICGATCKVGSDDDFQVYCAKCTCSFREHDVKVKTITSEKYEEMKENAYRIYNRGGWEAFD